jgi:hypothetical protein
VFHRVQASLTRVITAFRGRKAHTLFLQVCQLILWKQCHALVHDHGFPEQFEAGLKLCKEEERLLTTLLGSRAGPLGLKAARLYPQDQCHVRR